MDDMLGKALKETLLKYQGKVDTLRGKINDVPQTDHNLLGYYYNKGDQSGTWDIPEFAKNLANSGLNMVDPRYISESADKLVNYPKNLFENMDNMRLTGDYSPNADTLMDMSSILPLSSVISPANAVGALGNRGRVYMTGKAGSPVDWGVGKSKTPEQPKNAMSWNVGRSDPAYVEYAQRTKDLGGVDSLGDTPLHGHIKIGKDGVLVQGLSKKNITPNSLGKEVKTNILDLDPNAYVKGLPRIDSQTLEDFMTDPVKREHFLSAFEVVRNADEDTLLSAKENNPKLFEAFKHALSRFIKKD